MDEMANRRSSRNYFPEIRFQIRFLAFLLGGALFQVLLTSAILYHFLHQNYQLLVRYAGLDKDLAQLLFHELHILIVAVSVTFILYLVVLTLIGISYSHRIAGPLFAIRRTIRDINDGKQAILQLRKRDEWLGLEEEFNQMLRTLKSQRAG
jgi:nitrogen fixation/metabolism regulation signal transduction histidine kinase